MYFLVLSSRMTDLEITKLCAEAMRLRLCNGYDSPKSLYTHQDPRSIDGREIEYNPLHDDAQAMALVKKFELRIDRNFEDGGEGLVWTVTHHLCMKYGGISSFDNRNLNRAICECVAKMQAAAR